MNELTVRVLIVDDEPLAGELLQSLVGQRAGFEVVAVAANAQQALAVMTQQTVDLLILDIEMPGMKGTELAAKLTHNIPFIFVTAHEQHAIEAFSLQALDYVMKPVQKQRLYAALNRARAHIIQEKHLRQAAPLISSINANKQGHLHIRTADAVTVVSYDDIVSLRSKNQYTAVVTTGKTHLMSHNLSQVCAQIQAPEFVRTHRSVVINLRHLSQMSKQANGLWQLIMNDGSKLPLSRSRHQLQKLFFQHLNTQPAPATADQPGKRQ